MKSNFWKKKFFLTVGALFLLVSTSYADQTPTVKVVAWPLKATIGDEITFVLRVEHDPNIKVMAPNTEKLKLDPFEIRSFAVLSPTKNNSKVVDVFKFTLTIFKLNDQAIPPIEIFFKNPNGVLASVTSPALTIKIVPVANHPKENDQIRPIKGPVSMDLAVVRSIILGAVALLLTIILIIKVILRRRKKMVDPESLKAPHERVTLELERLKAKKLLNQGKAKEFYTEFSEILRRYLERQFKIQTFEMTTAEVLLILKKNNFELAVCTRVKDFLDNTDLVKFAKYLPEEALAAKLEQELLEIVHLTKPKEPEVVKK